MSPSQSYEIDEHEVISEVFDGDAVVIQMRTGAYYSFPADVTSLWERLTEAADLAVLAEEDGTPEFWNLLKWLEAEELIRFTPPLEEDRLGQASGSGPRGIMKFTDMAEMLIADPIHDIDYEGDALEPRGNS